MFQDSLLVRSVGLEPTRLATHAPQTCLSADFSMTAHKLKIHTF